jgi:hypothetical protein
MVDVPTHNQVNCSPSHEWSPCHHHRRTLNSHPPGRSNSQNPSIFNLRACMVEQDVSSKRSGTIHSTQKFHSHIKQYNKFMTIASVVYSHIVQLSQCLISGRNFHEIRDYSFHLENSLKHQAMQQVHEECNCCQFIHTTFTMLDLVRGLITYLG